MTLKEMSPTNKGMKYLHTGRRVKYIQGGWSYYSEQSIRKAIDIAIKAERENSKEIIRLIEKDRRILMFEVESVKEKKGKR